MLIAIDNPQKSVMHYLADDKSPDAIAAEVRRAGFAGHTWREITKADYEAIRAARPKPKPVLPSLPATADAGMMEALGVLVDAVERLDAKNRELAAKLESVIDVTHTTDVRGD